MVHKGRRAPGSISLGVPRQKEAYEAREQQWFAGTRGRHLGIVVRCHHSQLARGGLDQAQSAALRPHFLLASEPVDVPEQT